MASPLGQKLRYYGFALLAVVAATLLRASLDPVLKDRFAYFLYYVALIVSCWYGTLGSSLVALALGELAGDWFFINPRRTFGPSDLRSLEALVTYVVVGVAITLFAEAHRRAAARSKVAQSRLHLALTAASAGIFDWDIVRDQITCSDQYYDVLGLAPGIPPAPDTWIKHLHPDDRPRVESVIREAMYSTDRHIRLDFRTLGFDGRQHWVHARWTLDRNSGSRATRVGGVILDVSDLKQAELALLRNEKLASAGKLAATVAHEINNPLEAITNLVYLAQHEDSVDAARAYLQMADCELHWVSQAVQRSLSFYRESKPPAPFELAQVLDEIVQLVSRKAKANSITIKTEYSRVPALIGIAGEIRQVFFNLLANSMDAVGANGTIRIRMSCCRFEKTRNAIRVSIADSGSGIKPSDIPRVFEPFFTTKTAAGTGLGLWVSRQIVERHGGHMHVRSSVRPQRTGTVISVVLPVPNDTGQEITRTGRATTAA